ncbi:TPM domain-containing protein [bacterium]|nr:TPM domain-containing protein [bacterium]
MKHDRIRKKIISFLLLWGLTCLFSGLYAQQFPDVQGYVNDFAGVISYAYENKIQQLAGEVEHKTGAQIAVVTVNDMNGMNENEYASRLFKQWGIGHRKRNDGLLILIAVQERRVKIETGYDIEPIIPDGKAGEILDRHVVPFLAQNNYEQGCYQGVLAVSDIIAREAGVQITGTTTRPVVRNTRSRGTGGCFSVIIILLLIIFTRGRIIPWLFLLSFGGGRGGGFSGGSNFGGGFGGFGGGMSGGGGASRGF